MSESSLAIEGILRAIGHVVGANYLYIHVILREHAAPEFLKVGY